MTDRELALRYAPWIHYDAADTIPLRAAGYTVFHGTARSRSFPKRTVRVEAPAAFTVEYACYFDYDIEHLYDLEHVWVTADAEGRVIGAEGSFHGKFLNLLVPGFPGSIPPDGTHVHAFCQPGKHAFLAAGEVTRLYPGWESCCSRAGGPVLIGNPFCAEFSPTGEDLFVPTAEDDRRSDRYLREVLSFKPTLDFSRAELPREDQLLPWEKLFEKIPAWIAEECRRLADWEQEAK